MKPPKGGFLLSGETEMHEQLSIKALPWFLKIIAAVIWAILALTLNWDINTDRCIKNKRNRILKNKYYGEL